MKQVLCLFTFLMAISAAAQVRKLKVEPNHSTVGFRISISGFTAVTGKFTDYEIKMDWNDEEITASTIDASIQAASINTGIPDRDDHLRTADFFDVEKYPLITFKSDSIQQINYANYVAFGKFDMHGVSKNIELPFQIIKMDGHTIGFKSRTEINRLDHGIGAGFNHTSMPDFLAETIQVEIDFWTKKRKD
ncbi:MAG: YceI family protein [Bacteroidota bacterium]